MRVFFFFYIHSPYSRATSPRLSLPHLELWARIKGLGLVGTGDCTHPLWLEELKSQMDEEGEGLYTVKKKVRDNFASVPMIPPPSDKTPRFVLTGEISTICKRGGRTRKVHHLVILPDFSAAMAFHAKLEGMGWNIRSDGRPILGIDPRVLLAMLLETDRRAVLIPAHIWTPWFSALGAESGFDSIEECYGDLATNIPAIETGLSSNPPMNWALESLDRFSIISNSDAHSPEKLGREATIYEIDNSFSSLRSALFSRSPSFSEAVLGTIEFFPQEGKYHYDGHRKCGVCMEPEDAKDALFICPVCGKRLTRGVMSRVLELAGRPVNKMEPFSPAIEGGNKRPYYSLIPLRELCAELLGSGPSSKKVQAAYHGLIEKGGSEFSILMDMGKTDLERLNVPGLSGEIIAKAIMKMRSGEVSVKAGYDGEYGRVGVQ
jgi:uncharacterized protein (TIGR00375 family)